MGQLMGVLGILKAGGAYVPLDPVYPAERQALMREVAQVGVVLTEAGVSEQRGDEAGKVLLMEKLWEQWEQDSARRGREEGSRSSGVEPEHLAYIIFTSGSTGKPKGIGMPHRALWNLMQWQRQESRVREGARTLQFTTMSFDVACQELFATWVSGGQLVVIGEQERRDAEQLLRVLEEEGVERLFVPFVALQQVALAGQKQSSMAGALCFTLWCCTCVGM